MTALARTFVATTTTLGSKAFPSERAFKIPIAPGSRATRETVIYVVDDEDGLIVLYMLFLEGAGYTVRPFTRRTDALVALATDPTPALLIMDYLGRTMPVENFMAQCLVMHPALPILMVGERLPDGIGLSFAKSVGFLQKPVTAKQFLDAVKAVLSQR